MIEFELLEKKDYFPNVQENRNIRLIKKITPLNINKVLKKELINLINNEKYFFYFIDINALKLFDKDVIKSISSITICKLTNESLEKLTTAEKIEFLNNDFLNLIDISIFSNISDNFFNQIEINQFKNAKQKVVYELIRKRKIEHLNKKVLKYFYQNYFNKIDEEKDIIYLLSKSGENFEYLTSDNFIYLDRFIGRTDKLDHFLDKLKKFRFSDEDSGENFYFNKGVLNYKEFINNDTMVVKNEEIKDKIQDFLSDGESYEIMKDYCIKCTYNEQNRQLAINTLKELLNETAYDIFKRIDQYRIYEILIIVDNNRDNHLKYYIQLFKIIREINSLQLDHPAEFDVRIRFFSRIINERFFNIDFLEKLAEQNLNNIRDMISIFFNGTDENAIPEALREQHVKVIKDYLEIVKQKYKIKEDEIIQELQKILYDKGDINDLFDIFIKGRNKNEKLYLDLMMQSIIEMPSFDKNVEEKVSTLFKYIRDIGLTIAGAKISSLTGSKLLKTAIVGAGAVKIIKNIKDDIIKSYFGLTNIQKKIYVMNYRNTPKSTCSIISKKIKENFRKVITPIGKFTDYLFRKKIWKMNDEAIGFDKFNFNFKETEKLLEECNTFRDKIINLYIEIRLSMIKPQYTQKLYNIKSQLIKHNSKKKSKKLKKFFRTKEKIVQYLKNKKKDELKQKFPEFIDSFSNRSKKFFNNVKGFFKGVCNGIGSIAFFANLRIKENKNETIEKLINGVKKEKYEKELKKYDEYEEECDINTARDDIEFMAKSSKDENILLLLDIEQKKCEQNLEKLRYNLKNNIIDNRKEFHIVSQEMEDIIFENNSDDKKELLLIK